MDEIKKDGQPANEQDASTIIEKIREAVAEGKRLIEQGKRHHDELLQQRSIIDAAFEYAGIERESKSTEYGNHNRQKPLLDLLRELIGIVRAHEGWPKDRIDPGKTFETEIPPATIYHLFLTLREMSENGLMTFSHYTVLDDIGNRFMEKRIPGADAEPISAHYHCTVETERSEYDPTQPFSFDDENPDVDIFYVKPLLPENQFEHVTIFLMDVPIEIVNKGSDSAPNNLATVFGRSFSHSVAVEYMRAAYLREKGGPLTENDFHHTAEN